MTSRTGAVEQVRSANLSSVLRLLHYGGPATRAELTAALGLNRSTVGALVADLSARGLAHEHAPETGGGVGRPSPLVTPGERIVVLAANPEVDAVELAVIGLHAEVIAERRVELEAPPGPHDVARTIATSMERWRTDPALSDARVAGIGIAVPGLVRARDGVIRWAPHLDWTAVPLAEFVEQAAGVPASIVNDATAGAIAEHRFGAGRGIDDLVYLNAGASGIGGGLIAGGTMIGGADGYAGEFGQNRLSADGAEVLEDLVHRDRVTAILGLGRSDEATLARAIDAALDGDGTPTARAVAEALRAELAAQRTLLAAAIADAVNAVNPARVVLGGYLATLLALDSAAPETLEQAVRARVARGAADRVELHPASLGRHRLLIGAAETAFAGILADPTTVPTLPAHEA